MSPSVSWGETLQQTFRSHRQNSVVIGTICQMGLSQETTECLIMTTSKFISAAHFTQDIMINQNIYLEDNKVIQRNNYSRGPELLLAEGVRSHLLN